jgi:hypothetical protein
MPVVRYERSRAFATTEPGCLFNMKNKSTGIGGNCELSGRL